MTAVWGGELYPIIQEKMKSGYVYPKGLKDLLRSYGFEVIHCRGNMNALKYEIRNGNPVIIIFEGVNPAIVKMTERLTPEIVQQLKEFSNVEPRGIISASTNVSDGRMSEKGELDHYIGVLSLAQGSANFETLEVEVGT